MSAVTRAKAGNRVRFKDSSGKLVEGIALQFHSDSLLVGVQSAVKPYVWGIKTRVPLKDGGSKAIEGWIPNNSLWAVPFSHVVETLQ